MGTDEKQLLPHQQRVVEEEKELAGKTDRLSEFLESERSKEITPLERHLMLRQLEYMQHYLRILKLRIKAFTA